MTFDEKKFHADRRRELTQNPSGHMLCALAETLSLPDKATQEGLDATVAVACAINGIPPFTADLTVPYSALQQLGELSPYPSYHHRAVYWGFYFYHLHTDTAKRYLRARAAEGLGRP